MSALLFLTFFVGTPLIELYFLIEVGQQIGALPTIGLCLLTAALGGLLVRMQGLSVLFRVQKSLAREEVPALELIEGAILLLTGFLLLLPGLVTDVLGFLALIPPLRQAAIIAFMKRQQVIHPGPRPGPEDQRTLEGEFKRDDDRDL